MIIRHRGFNAELRERMQRLIRVDCRQVEPGPQPPRTAWRIVVSTLVFHVLHHFPRWAERLPAHRPKVESVQ